MVVQAQVCWPVLNLYAQPMETSEVVSQALYGWTISLLEKYRDFCRIQTPDDYSGWVDTQGVAFFSGLKSRHKSVKMIYNAVPVYPVPHAKNKPLWVLPFEVELPVLAEPIEEEGRWIQVELIGGKAGWVQRGHIKEDLRPLSLVQMLQMSRQFLGLPYLWGGISSFGYDCSGFIQMLWRQRGIILPRDARQQFCLTQAQPVAWEELEPGDCLFYGSCADDIRHVGLYCGEQTLIHASVKPLPLVQESHLEELSLRQRFTYRTAKRLYGFMI